MYLQNENHDSELTKDTIPIETKIKIHKIYGICKLYAPSIMQSVLDGISKLSSSIAKLVMLCFKWGFIIDNIL